MQADEINEQSWHDLRLDKMDQAAPDFLLDNGKSLSGYHGQWVVLHFWATWCKPCARELPELDHLYTRWRDQKVAFFTVAIDSKDQVSTFVEKLGLQLPVLIGDDTHAPDRYWNWGLPVTYIINPEGQIVARALGAREWDSAAGDELFTVLTNSEPAQYNQNLGLQQ